MTYPSKITNHVEQGLALLTSRWSNMPRVRQWLSVYLLEIQELEDLIWETIEDFLDTAGTHTLDVYGVLLKQARLGLNNDTYRLFLKARIAVNRSTGHPEDVIKVARLLVARNWYRDQFPRSFRVEIDPGGYGLQQIQAVARLICDARAVNSACEVIATEAEGDAGIFRFGAINTESTPSDTGFNNGKWAYTVPH